MNRYYYSEDMNEITFVRERLIKPGQWQWTKITGFDKELIHSETILGEPDGLNYHYIRTKYNDLNYSAIQKTLEKISPKYLMVIKNPQNLSYDFRVGFGKDKDIFPVFEIDFKTDVLVPSGVIYDRKFK